MVEVHLRALEKQHVINFICKTNKRPDDEPLGVTCLVPVLVEFVLALTRNWSYSSICEKSMKENGSSCL